MHKKPYHFIYSDNSYYTYMLDKDDIMRIMQSFPKLTEPRFVTMSFGCISTEGLRGVIEVIEVPQENEVGTPPEYANDEWLYGMKTKSVEDGDENGDD